MNDGMKNFACVNFCEFELELATCDFQINWVAVQMQNSESLLLC